MTTSNNNHFSLERAVAFIALENPKAVWGVKSDYHGQTDEHWTVLDFTFSSEARSVIATYDMTNGVLTDSDGNDYDREREARAVRNVLSYIYSTEDAKVTARAYADIYGIDISSIAA